MAETKKEDVKVVIEKPAEKVTAPTKPTVALDSWLYHKEFAPKLFKKGAVIEEGWGPINSYGWYKDPDRHFSWAKK